GRVPGLLKSVGVVPLRVRELHDLRAERPFCQERSHQEPEILREVRWELVALGTGLSGKLGIIPAHVHRRLRPESLTAIDDEPIAYLDLIDRLPDELYLLL